jgi:hypothetical protein
MLIESCVFNNNTIDFSLNSDSTVKFSVLNCVFSGTLPSSAFYDLASGNTFEMSTETVWLSHFYSRYCPGVTPGRTPAPTPLASTSRAASGTIPETGTIPATAAQTPMATPTVTCNVIDGFVATAPADIENYV